MVKVVPNTNEDSIWIKLNSHTSIAREYIYIGTFYPSPTHKRNKNGTDLFITLNEEIKIFKSNTNIFIQGDFTGRISDCEDFIKHDKEDEIFGIENNTNLPTRNPENTFIDSRGRELLDICKTNDYIVLNGRKTGDVFGNYTSHQWNGSSVADYIKLWKNT